MSVPLPATSAIPGDRVRLSPATRRAPPRILQSGRGVVALVLATLIVGGALFAPLLAPYDPAVQDLAHKLEPPNREHLLGTDQFGRDLLTRILSGGRNSLITGVGSVAIGAPIGVIIGLIAG